MIKAVSPEGYKDAVMLVLLFVIFHRLTFSFPEEIDAALTFSVDEMFASGEDVPLGRTTLSGFRHYFWEFSSKEPHKLPRTERAIESWAKKGTPASRSPLPWSAACAIAAVLASQGDIKMAVYVLVTFDLYGRPSESFALEVGGVIPAAPEAGFRTPAVRLNPLARGRSSKTGR